MAKKLVTALLTITIIACSSISIYATDTNITDTTEAKATATTEDSEQTANTTVKVQSMSTKTNSKYKKGLAAYIRKIKSNVSKIIEYGRLFYFKSKEV